MPASVDKAVTEGVGGEGAPMVNAFVKKASAVPAMAAKTVNVVVLAAKVDSR